MPEAARRQAAIDNAVLDAWFELRNVLIVNERRGAPLATLDLALDRAGAAEGITR